MNRKNIFPHIASNPTLHRKSERAKELTRVKKDVHLQRGKEISLNYRRKLNQETTREQSKFWRIFKAKE